MNDEILLHALKKSVLPVLEKLLNLSHYQDDKYMYTFIVNKQEKNCYEPLFSLEDFYKYLLCSLGKSNSVCREVYEFLKKKKYLFFYEGMCTIEQFVNSNG